MESCKPDFDNSLVNLMSLFGEVMQRESQSIPAVIPKAFIDTDVPYQLQSAKHIMLVIVDGLGADYLEAQHNSFLRSKSLGIMSSVFPSSTAPAITSYLSGLSPAQHGVFGWFQWMQSIGQVCACLPFQARATGVSLAEHGIAAEDYYTFSSFFQSLPRPSVTYSPEQIAGSAYNSFATRGAKSVGYETWSDLIPKVKQNIQAASGPTYQYIYWPNFDSSCHEFGLHSKETAETFKEVDQALATLAEALAGEDVAMVVTADHGMIDTTPPDQLMVGDFPDIANQLTMPLCGEPRVAYCHVRAKAHVDFERIVREQLGDKCECFTVDALINEGWFGPERTVVPPHHYDALGDFVLIMKDHYTLEDVIPGKKESAFIGMHGGTTKAEMEVPLCWVPC